MKRIFTFALLCSFTITLVQTTSAQTRPRRVGSTSTQQSQPQSQTQTNDASQAARP